VVVAGFSVNAAGLPAMSRQMRRVADDVGAIRAHLGKIDVATFSGALDAIKGPLEDVVHAQTSSAVDAESAAQQVADEVTNSIDYYRTTDSTQMAAFDAQLSASAEANFQFPDQGSDSPAGSYADVAYPRGRLSEPPSYAEEMSWQPKLSSDLGSITGFVRAVVKFVTGVDPVEPLEKWAAGDWAEVRRIADRFNNVAWAFHDCADNVQHCSTSSEADWVGNAGDGARHYLGLLGTGCYGEYEKNEFLYSQIKDVAEGIFETANALVDIASDWINNKLLPAIASIGIAGGTAEIPVVDFLAAGAAGWSAYQALKEGAEVYEKANKINSMIAALTAALTVGQGGHFDLPGEPTSIPADTYISPVSPKD
jgi:hypothetical protein